MLDLQNALPLLGAKLWLSPSRLSRPPFKMTWAAKRKTTRVEDEAYCLMGIFGVNMPILYGEGANAFFRLQQEILKQSDDESIFAWKSANDLDNNRSGILAQNAADFKHAGDIIRLI